MNDFSALQKRLDIVGGVEFARKLAFEGVADNLRLAFVQKYGFPGNQVAWGYLDGDRRFNERMVPRTRKSESTVSLMFRFEFEVKIDKAIRLTHLVSFDLRIRGDEADVSLPGWADWIVLDKELSHPHFATALYENLSSWVAKQERILFLDSDAP